MKQRFRELDQLLKGLPRLETEKVNYLNLKVQPKTWNSRKEEVVDQARLWHNLILNPVLIPEGGILEW